jgi:predicted SAM-dependent methyltransferase
MSGITSIVRKVIPKRYHQAVARYAGYAISPLFYGRRFVCPICGGHFRKFLSFGVKPRPNARCPRCGSLERHRLLWLYLRDRTNFFTDNLKVLDIAPMGCLQHKFRIMLNLDYVSVDLESAIAMIKMDITAMQFSDNHFGCIICYHVLEHVSDDQRAMKEIFRVLKPDGWAILQVPILREKTFEDPTITNPEERGKVFGQRDHVRIYGLDYKDRLESVGFIVKVDDYVKKLGHDAIKKYGLIKDENIYLCSKPNTKEEKR